MILLFGDKATRTAKANKNTNVRNNPVENSGILAMNPYEAKSLLSVGEYDTYISSHPVDIDYSMFADSDFVDADSNGFMGEFSSAIAMLGDCGFTAGGFDCGGASSFASSGSFCSVG